MDKIKLKIIGMSYSQAQTGAYALILGEESGDRRIPIVIGGFEAQAIAIELEDMKTARPLTHDLFKNFALEFNIKIKEVLIYDLSEGIFYAKLICDQDGVTKEVDARTSDAIAMAVRFKCPVYTYASIMDSAGIKLDEGDELESMIEVNPAEDSTKKDDEDGFSKLTVSELENQLDSAVENEDYELASKIRDEINRRTS